MATRYKKQLLSALCAIDNPRQMDALLKDILTPAEYAEIPKRFEIVRQLMDGAPQRQIAKKLNVSISKVTRGSRVVHEGAKGVRAALEAT